jgi:hypothetical protein
MHPDTRCPVEGCTSTNPGHIDANLEGRATAVHQNKGHWFFRCPSRIDDARCLRPDEHGGPHVYADVIPDPEPVYELDEVEADITVTHGGRNKPAFQHLLNKRKEQP